ncbi:MAG: hypothetical protein RL227_495, partial [Pseudomonadota bacterium]
MKVAITSYPMLFQTKGGLSMKLGRTATALRERGVEAELFDSVRQSLKEFDLVHVFAPYNGNHRIVEQAKADGLPLVMSTILNPPMSKMDGLKARLLSRVVSRLTGWTVSTSYQQMSQAIHMADHLITLGSIERTILTDAFLVDAAKVTIVPNGIGHEFFAADGRAFLEQYPIRRPFVLHTGIIGDVKNQLGLVKALQHEDIDIVLIGNTSQANKDYLAKCLEIGGERVHYLGEMQHGAGIASAYAAAAAVAVPSRHEGMPNVILEGMAADRPVVLTNNHTMDMKLPANVAREVAPDDHAGIRHAVMDLVRNPP